MSISTLVVGVGGTGTLVLRALKKRYEETRVDERVPASFLALDFDRSALSSDNNEQAFAPLSEEDFLYLNPGAIQELLRNIDRTQDGQLAWERVRRWFPDPERVRIPTSEVEANGASQLRPLGRLGFFLNDELLETTLRRKLGGLRAEVDSVRLSTAKRVIVVSSLAGGTGGGMLLDIAYLLRRQDARPRVFLYLLLPEVFVDLDSGGRVLPNSYGLLKELAHLKEQQIPFHGDYLRIAPVHVAVAREEPFARLFLFSGAANGGAEPIHDICARIAEAILGQLHRTIQEKALAIVANTISGSRDEEQRRRRTHCFSTSGSTFLELRHHSVSSETLAHYIADEVLQASEADFDADPEVQQLLNGLAANIERLGAGPAGTGADSTRDVRWTAPADAEPENAERGAEQALHPKITQIARAWKHYIDDAVAANADAIVADLGRTLKGARVRLQAAVGHTPSTPKPAAGSAPGASAATPLDAGEPSEPSPIGVGAASVDQLAGAREDIDGLRRLVLAAFDEESYATNLEALKKAAPSFARYDTVVRKAVSTFFPTLEAALETGTRQARRQFLRSMERLDRPFRVTFSSADSEARADLRAAWEQRRSQVRPTGVLAWIGFGTPRDRDINNALLDVDALERGLAQPELTRHITEILKVRAYKEWKRGLEVARQIAERAWRDVARPFDDLPLPEKRSDGVESLPGDLRIAVRRAVADQLPAIVDAAQRFATLEPIARKQRLMALLDAVRARIPVLRNVQVEVGAGFPDAVRDALVRARQAVFERRTPNPQRKGFAIILVPHGLFETDERKHLKGFLASAAVQILDSRCQIEHYQGTRVWIYYEDLFNPPEHLKNLDEYHRVYAEQPYKELFHADRRFLDNPTFVEIHSATSRTIVTCGNDGCLHNLAGVARSEHVCPRCEKMIRSRCGNLDCTLDNLQDDEHRNARLCPRCHGFNHGAWWRCQRHGKLDHEVPIDKPRCPRCIELHLEDPVGYPEECISTRPDVARQIECPCCRDLRRQRPDHEVFRIPQALRDAYVNGVNGHMLKPFEKLARDHGLVDGVRCPNCRTLLIPLHHALLQPGACGTCVDHSQACACQPAEAAPVAAHC